MSMSINAPELSMIHFFVDNGYDVFVTDWKVITEKTRRSTMEDYLTEITRAKEVIRNLTGQEELGALAVPFCNVAALFDHIAPFPNALYTAYLIGTPPEKQMTIKVEGGHVRGVVNPPLYPGHRGAHQTVLRRPNQSGGLESFSWME